MLNKILFELSAAEIKGPIVMVIEQEGMCTLLGISAASCFLILC